MLPSVHAADLIEPAYVPPAPPPPVEVVSTAGWYLRGDVGYVFSQESDGEYRYATTDNYGDPLLEGQHYNSFKTDSAFYAGGGLGYRLNDFARFDVTADYFSSDLRGSSNCVGFASSTCSYDDHSSVDIWTVMANAYVDFYRSGRFSTYVGAGAGGAYVNYSDLKNKYSCWDPSIFAADNQLCDNTYTHAGYSKWRFAASLMAGATYDITDHLKFDAGYKYTRISSGDAFGFDEVTRVVATPAFRGATTASTSIRSARVCAMSSAAPRATASARARHRSTPKPRSTTSRPPITARLRSTSKRSGLKADPQTESATAVSTRAAVVLCFPPVPAPPAKFLAELGGVAYRRGDDARNAMSTSTTPAVSPEPTRPKLAFVVTEDWFFASHFLPMVSAAAAAGFAPIVITRVRSHAAVIEAAGATVVEMEADRGSVNPLAAVRSVLRLRRILRRERVSVVHLIALRSIVLGGFAAFLAGVDRRVLAVTGGGLLSARSDLVGRISAAVLIAVVRHLVATQASQYLFENADDPRTFGLEPSASHVTIVGGAGIDPRRFAELPFVDGPPFRVAVVSRMLWSKGIDLIVDAVSMARQGGADIVLSLYGAPDPANPRAIARERLEEWSTREGVAWNGVSRDVRAVWQAHHLACLPSRGGEGLPRTLLEAAACGRAILTTDVPGCRSFVRDGIDGYVVAPDDVAALCKRLIFLSGNPDRAEEMGRNARSRVLEGYTEEAVVKAVTAMYRERFPV